MKDLVQVLVISLPDAADRRRLMAGQLDQPGMPPFRFLDAVDGRGRAPEDFGKQYDGAAALAHGGRTLTGPEIGCAASHLAAYREILAGDASIALVLEDDALLGHQSLKVIERVLPTMSPAAPQAVLLSHVGRYTAWGGGRLGRLHRLYRPYSAFGAHAYLITRAGATAMLAALDPVFTVADDWRRFMKAGILDVKAVVPYPVGTAPGAASSQIGTARLDGSAPRSAGRWLRKVLWQKFLFQLVAKPLLRLRKQESTW